MPVRGVLLDVDGTLVDSNDAHAHAWVKALAESGYLVSFKAVRPFIGMGGDKLLPKVCGLDLDSSVGKRVSVRRREIFAKEFLPQLRPCRGAARLLGLFENRGFRLVVASSSNKEELGALLKICGAQRLASSATSADDADQSKPDPDILQAALHKLAISQSEVLMLGDTPYDIEASRRAGVGVVALRCGGWKDEDLKADAIFDDPADLAEHFEDSPFAR
jgi:HAD superfamily hydrolase (TIGR01509 family)